MDVVLRSDWRAVVRHGWSIRFILAAGAVIGLNAALQIIIGMSEPTLLLAAFSGLVAAAAFVLQLFAQTELPLTLGGVRRSLLSRALPSAQRASAIAAIAVSLISGFEGCSTVAYLDPVGIPTACFGHTRDIRMGQHFTKAECDGMLKADLPKYEAQMNHCLVAPNKIPDKTYGAFTSATYNLGGGSFCKNFAPALNAGRLADACNLLPGFNHASLGRVKITLPGLTRRRAEERALCLEGVAEGKVTP